MGSVVSCEPSGSTIRIQNTKSSKLRKQSARSRLELYKDMEHGGQGGQGGGYNNKKSGKANSIKNKKIIIIINTFLSTLIESSKNVIK